MRRRILDALICPECSSPFNLTILKQSQNDISEFSDRIRCVFWCIKEGINSPRTSSSQPKCGNCYKDEIIDGLLECGCGKVYPVIGGIPRILPDAFDDNPAFVGRYHLDSQGYQEAELSKQKFKKLHKRTQKSFSFEWLRYEVTDADEDRKIYFLKMGVTPEELQSKLVLDAGCGMGRYLNAVNKHGCETVGLDLSQAVERAYELTKESLDTHIVQGNIMNPPFRADAFDYVYSLGVLHHTPDTSKAFEALVPLLKKGGCLSMWVYVKWEPWRESINSAWRTVTKRLPHKVLHCYSYLAIPKGYIDRKLVLSNSKILRYVGTLSSALVPVSHHPKWQVRLCDTFDWLSPQYQHHHTNEEVKGWFEENGFREIRVLSFPVSVTGIKN